MNNFKLCITVCMCTALLVLTNLASAQFSGGNGYSNNPWQIKNEGDFYGINDRNYIGMDNVNEPNVYFKLMNDITLNYPRGVPFGDLSNPFIGYFDGNGHTITIKSGGGSTLFGRLPGGIDQISTIENLTVYAEGSSGMIVLRNQGLIRNCKVYGTINAGSGETVGALVNTNWGTINNCESFCTSVAGGGWTGGLVGDNTGGIITNCINHAPVSSNGYVGGIVGENDGAIENCHNEGEITVISSNGGGIAGDNKGGTILRSANLSAIKTGTDIVLNVGGIVGYGWGSIEEYYNLGDIKGKLQYAGGIVGDNFGSGINSYSIYTVINQADWISNYNGSLIGRQINETVINCYIACYTQNYQFFLSCCTI